MMIGDGDELHFTNTGDELWRESAKYAMLRAPRDVGLLIDDLLDGALLLDFATASGMLPIAGAMVSIGEMQHFLVRDTEKEKG